MLGNVSEWTLDLYKADNTGLGSVSPLNWSSGHFRVLRGGDWSSPASTLRSASRQSYFSIYRNYAIGFRLVHSP